VGGLVYHVLNRANRRATLFEEAGDYQAFHRVVAAAQGEHPVPLLAYCVMPNHWHLVLAPQNDGDLSRFVGWLTLTHTQRWHARRHSVGSGHLYQGRFKFFPIEADEHLLTVCRYVERHALRACLVERAEVWPWGSLYQRERAEVGERPALAEWPVPLPADWLDQVNAPQTPGEEAAVRHSVRRGQPFGSEAWSERLVETLGLASTLRRPGRPPQAPPGPRPGLVVWGGKWFLTPGVPEDAERR
jgi:putative transposase